MEHETSTEVREWLESTAKLMVDRPDDVRVEEVLSPDGSSSFFSVYVCYSDLGKIVGKEGSNIMAIRKLSSAMCQALYRRRCEVTAYDPTKQNRDRRG